MFNWLGALPVWFQIIFSAGAFICLFVSLFFIIKRGIQIKSKGQMISVGNDGNQIEDRRSPHRSCPHNKDIIILLNRSSKIIHEKLHLEYVQRMRDQMNYAEQKINQIRAMLQKSYLSCLEEKGIEDLTDSMSYKSYRSILIEIQDHILQNIRHFLRENHFAEFNESGFQNYIENKIEFAKVETTDLFNRLYFCKADIPREELYNLNQDIANKARSIFIDIFVMARIIAIESDLRLKECDTLLQNVLDEYI